MRRYSELKRLKTFNERYEYLRIGGLVGEHVFSYGSAASLGPVRCMTVNAARTKLWGVAGYKDSVSTIFSFDETDGLKQLAILTYNSAGGFDGPTAANLLTSIALSPDEKYLAVGGGDRLGSVHVIKIG